MFITKNKIIHQEKNSTELSDTEFQIKSLEKECKYLSYAFC